MPSYPTMRHKSYSNLCVINEKKFINLRFINLELKNKNGRLPKAIIENINKQLRNTLNLKHWNNTSKINDWFKNIQNRNEFIFMIFDIKDIYPSISKDC